MQPDRRDAQVLQVVELLDQAAEVADAIAVGITERAHMKLVDDRVFVPVRASRLHESSMAVYGACAASFTSRATGKRRSS